MNESKGNKHMQEDWGSWTQAEDWRRQGFSERTPEQRLRWLKGALVLAYRAGAIELAEAEGK